GLPARLVRVVRVADLSDRGAAGEQYAPHLSRREAQDTVRRVLGDELDARPRRARELRALPRAELDGVNDGSGRDLGERQRVAGPDVGACPRLDGRADAEPDRREDVRLRAVRVVQQRDARRPVRVVLDRGHLRRDAVLDALEVDPPVTPLVAAALVAGRDATTVVPSARLLERLEQRLLRRRRRDLVERRGGHLTSAGARGLVL